MRTNPATGIATLEIQRIGDGIYRPTDYHLAKVMSWGARQLAPTCLNGPAIIDGMNGDDRAAKYEALADQLDETLDVFDTQVRETDVLPFHIDQDTLAFAEDSLSYARLSGKNAPELAGDFHSHDIESKMHDIAKLIAARNVHAGVAAIHEAALV